MDRVHGTCTDYQNRGDCIFSRSIQPMLVLEPGRKGDRQPIRRIIGTGNFVEL